MKCIPFFVPSQMWTPTTESWFGPSLCLLQALSHNLLLPHSFWAMPNKGPQLGPCTRWKPGVHQWDVLACSWMASASHARMPTTDVFTTVCSHAKHYWQRIMVSADSHTSSQPFIVGFFAAFNNLAICGSVYVSGIHNMHADVCQQ